MASPHTFDADKIVGKITVRQSQIGERVWPLFLKSPLNYVNRCWSLPMMKILAIAELLVARVKTTETTTRIFIESATFDPVSTRKAGRILGVHTDSRRGADPEMPLKGIGRVVHILENNTIERSSPCCYSANWTALWGFLDAHTSN